MRGVYVSSLGLVGIILYAFANVEGNIEVNPWGLLFMLVGITSIFILPLLIFSWGSSTKWYEAALKEEHARYAKLHAEATDLRERVLEYERAYALERMVRPGRHEVS